MTDIHSQSDRSDSACTCTELGYGERDPQVDCPVHGTHSLPEQSASLEKRLHAAQAVLDTAQRAYDAEPSIETAMLLDAARRKFYLVKRECRS